VQEAARQPTDPQRERGVHLVGDAAAQQDLAKQNEQRDGSQDVLVLHAPDHRPHRFDERPAEG
jgi:hypothetical protein